MNIYEEIDNVLEKYKCKAHSYPSNDNPHGCTDCYNHGYIFDCEEAFLLEKCYGKIKSLEAQVKILKEACSAWDVDCSLMSDEAAIINIRNCILALKQVEEMEGK